MRSLKNIMSAAAGVLGLSPEQPLAAKKYPANPDRVPHHSTSHPNQCGTHRTRNSAVTVTPTGRQGMAHGPKNVGEHPIYRGYHVPRSKYKPRIDIPKSLRMT